jgi:hypothetical protein
MPSVPAVASACPCGGIPDWKEVKPTLVGFSRFAALLEEQIRFELLTPRS